VPRSAIFVQVFDDFQQFNPHLHLIAIDGCFSGFSAFTVGSDPAAKDLENLLSYEVPNMNKAGGKNTEAVIENMLGFIA
jgi:hypothetical protein